MGAHSKTFEEKIKHFIGQVMEQFHPTQSWYVLNDNHQVICADKHEWDQWSEAQGDGVLWDCAIGDMRIVTLFLGAGQRLFETLAISDAGNVEILAVITLGRQLRPAIWKRLRNTKIRLDLPRPKQNAAGQTRLGHR